MKEIPSVLYTSLVADKSDALTVQKYAYTKENSLGSQAPLHLLASIVRIYEAPFTMNILNENTCILIHSLHGAGKVESNGTVYNLTDNQALFLSGPCMITPKVLPWDMRIYMIDGSDLVLYQPLFNQAIYDCTSFSVFLEKLAYFPCSISPYHLFDMHRSLTNVLVSTILLTVDEPSDVTFIPSYLQVIHDTINKHPERPFSLAYFEKKHGISRYRIAHEYSAYYHISPLKECNQLRIAKAKEMLISSDLQVQEISRLVGINDVNHFISLFRKTFGCSPNTFRKTERDHLSLPNSHAE